MSLEKTSISELSGIPTGEQASKLKWAPKGDGGLDLKNEQQTLE